jgi:hypothetical protein
MLLGYAQNYYFHLRKFDFYNEIGVRANRVQDTTKTMLISGDWS